MSETRGEPILSLLARRRFWPLFATQFLGAANDNLCKSAIAVLIVFRLLADNPGQARLLAALAPGALIIPYILFSSLAGELADRLEKSRLIRLVKSFEIVLALLATAALFSASPAALLAVLFLFGLHSTFFGPLKYAILPQHLSGDELLGGNGLIEGGTFIAILIGTILGSLVVLADGGLAWTGGLMIALAVAGRIASARIPEAAANQPDLKLTWNLWRGSRSVMRTVTTHKRINRAVAGIGWFWAVGAIYLGQFAAFAKQVLGADEQVVSLMLAMFSVGVALGAVSGARLLRGQVSTRLAPYAAAGMALFGLDLYFSAQAAAQSATVLSGAAFAGSLAGLRVLADLLLLSACGGAFAVPLYAIVQAWSDQRERARAVAASNIVISIYLAAATAVVAVLFKLGLDVPGVFLAAAAGNAVAAGLAAWGLRDEGEANKP